MVVSEQSLLAIAREADGSLRDAQTLLDQSSPSAGAEIDDEQVADILDLVDRRLLLANRRGLRRTAMPAAALEACARAGARPASTPSAWGRTCSHCLRDLVVLRIAPDTDRLVEGGDAEIAELRALSESCEETRLRRMFRALLKEQEDLAWAPQPFAVLEMAVVRLATMPTGDDVAQLLARLDALERADCREDPGSRGSGGTHSAWRTPQRDVGPQRPEREARAARKTNPRARGAPTEQAASPTAPRGGAADSPAERRKLRRTPGRGTRPPARLHSAKDHPGLVAALEGGHLLERDDQHMRCLFPSRSPPNGCEIGLEPLEAACEKFFGHPIRVEIETAEARCQSWQRSGDGRKSGAHR